MKTYKMLPLCVVIMCCLLACAGQKKQKRTVQTTHSQVLVDKKLPKNINFSAGFKLFWNDFAEETKHLTTLNGYIPSEEMLLMHNIQRFDDGEYGIQGFLQVQKSIFDEDAFKHLGGTLTHFNADLYTFSMPLKMLPEMLKVPGIVQVEMAAKAYLRRSTSWQLK